MDQRNFDYVLQQHVHNHANLALHIQDYHQ